MCVHMYVCAVLYIVLCVLHYVYVYVYECGCMCMCVYDCMCLYVWVFVRILEYGYMKILLNNSMWMP